MSRNQTLFRTYIYKQRLDAVVRGQASQTTQLATGRIEVARLIEQLQQLQAEGKEYIFLTGFLATDRTSGLMHTRGHGEEMRVGINIKLSTDLPAERSNGTYKSMGEAFPKGKEEPEILRNAPKEEGDWTDVDSF